jgi:signal transduction histidine kinase
VFTFRKNVILADDQGGRFEGKISGAGTLAAVPSLLRQLLFNLLTNALKFNVEGGRVSLRVEKQVKKWRWTMEDEGPGLPVHELDRVFDRFVRLGSTGDKPMPPGHGLGLAICKSIVALHGGEIWAENRPDVTGLRVVVVLPAASDGSE